MLHMLRKYKCPIAALFATQTSREQNAQSEQDGHFKIKAFIEFWEQIEVAFYVYDLWLRVESP